MATSESKTTLLADWQKMQHNPILRLALFLVYGGFIAVVGLIPAWLLDWNRLVLAAVLTTAATTFLIGVIEALRELEIQRGNALGAQLLSNLEHEVLSWHGVTPEIVNNLKQLALTVAPDLLAAAEGKGVQPSRFPGQPTDIADLAPGPMVFGAAPAPQKPPPATPTSGGVSQPVQHMPVVPGNWADAPVAKNEGGHRGRYD